MKLANDTYSYKHGPLKEEDEDYISEQLTSISFKIDQNRLERFGINRDWIYLRRRDYSSSELRFNISTPIDLIDNGKYLLIKFKQNDPLLDEPLTWQFSNTFWPITYRYYLTEDSEFEIRFYKSEYFKD